MLIVVEHRYLKTFTQGALDLKARRSGDVLEVDATEADADARDRVNDLLHCPWLDHDGERGHAGEFGEQQRLPFHHGQRRERTDVAETEDGRAIGDDRDGVRALGEGPRSLGIGSDRAADPGHTGRVHEREIVAVAHGNPTGHRDLAAQMHQEGPV